MSIFSEEQISEWPSFSNSLQKWQNWPFAATSGQIILFLFKSRHCRTYFRENDM